MKKIALLVLLSAGCMFADVSGKWSGSAQDDQEKTLFFVLKQDGATLTGTAGPREDQQHVMQKAKLDGDHLTFEVPIGDRGTIAFDLKLSGDALQGDVELRRSEGDVEKHKVELKRVK
jgi:hypothetical protein